LRKLFAKYSESERKKKPIAFSLIVPIFGGFFFFYFFSAAAAAAPPSALF